jgi:hypothetical protein
MQPGALFVLALTSLTATACVRVSSTRLAPATTAIHSDSVRVFATQSPAEYQELAVLRTRRFLASDSHVMTALRRHAARLGANGLLLLNTRGSGGVQGSGVGVVIGGPRDGEVIVGNVQTNVDELERAVAIRYPRR